jgi:hypothetical protein
MSDDSGLTVKSYRVDVHFSREKRPRMITASQTMDRNDRILSMPQTCMLPRSLRLLCAMFSYESHPSFDLKASHELTFETHP